MSDASSNGDRSRPASTPSVVAIDLGAESCRVSLLRWIDGEPRIQLVHRFPNAPVKQANSLRWNLEFILRGIEEGLRACAEAAPEGIASIGVDGWAVDYARLNAAGTFSSNPFCYRDERTITAQKSVHTRISPERLYELTGVQDLSLNTLYQLFADCSAGEDASGAWINLPEFVLYHLGGQRVAEYTNATHTQLLAAKDKTWCDEIFRATGLDINSAPAVVPPGSNIGRLQGHLAALPAFRNTHLIAPACHDTASAIAGIHAQGNDWAFISSGTWSLVGCVLDSPCASTDARSKNFSNEGGIGGRINFLKNVNGMWLLQQCVDQWRSQGDCWTVEALVESCASLPAPEHLLDVDDPELLLPGNMPERIHKQLSRTQNGAAPASTTPPQMARLIFESLAARYAAVLRDAARITGKKLKRLFIVGGGSKNAFLNQLTATATGLEVVTGAAESATIGNFAIQLGSLAGDYSKSTGVSATSVAKWAGTLMALPICQAATAAESVLPA